MKLKTTENLNIIRRDVNLTHVTTANNVNVNRPNISDPITNKYSLNTTQKYFDVFYNLFSAYKFTANHAYFHILSTLQKKRKIKTSKYLNRNLQK